MSVHFGRWNFDGAPSQPGYLEKVSALLAPYGPDGRSAYSKGEVDILYYAFHTTKESRQEVQPYVLPSGTVITWDGRLDNCAEFIGLMRDRLSQDSPDVAIVAAAYERWGTDCFARLLGDWALAIWNPMERLSILAKDPIGTHHLYYSVEPGRITWSTVLDPLVLLANRAFALEEEYIAGWLAMFPATHLTPYVGIHSVPPCCFVRSENGKQTPTKYWDFDPGKEIRYSSDPEYEEHFRAVFAESVRRRLRSDAPVLAELSGGIDSSSIVCMADTLMARGSAGPPRLDTLSFYNESEPSWNEQPYFTKVEEMRGRKGYHIDLSGDHTSSCPLDNSRFAASPAACGFDSNVPTQVAGCIATQGGRVVLSGIGGDEVTGGIPTPTPELADLLARAQFKTLAHQLKAWALSKRRPWFHLLFEAACEFFPVAFANAAHQVPLAPWLRPEFVNRNRVALQGYGRRLRFFGPLPSFQENLVTLDALRRQMECHPLPSAPPYQRRYPYLDRDLLEFLFTIPTEQLVRPNQRRSLMRRALVGIVPSEILNRKRKAYIARPSIAIELAESFGCTGPSQGSISASLGIVDPNRFSECLHGARRGEETPMVNLMRTIALELWLRGLSGRVVCPGSLHAKHHNSRPSGTGIWSPHDAHQTSSAS